MKNKAVITTSLIGLACAVFALALSSCAGRMVFDLNSNPNDGELRGPLTGTVYRQTEDGSAKAVVDSVTVATWFKKVTDLISGKGLKETALEPPTLPVVPNK